MTRKLVLAIAGWLLFAGIAFAQININTATTDELDSLKGIGPTKAKAIIDYRKKNGPFKSVDDLENVPGIGPATLKDIRGSVMVSGASQPLPATAQHTSPGKAQPRATAPARPTTPAVTPAARPAEHAPSGAPATPARPAPAAADGAAPPAAPAAPAQPARPSGAKPAAAAAAPAAAGHPPPRRGAGGGPRTGRRHPHRQRGQRRAGGAHPAR